MTPRLRSQVLSEFRGYWEPKKRPDRCVTIHDALGPVLKKFGLAERLDENEINQVWHELVGDFVAQHSKPDRLKDGVLYVRVIQSTLLYDLDREWKPEVLRKLRAKFGPRKIRNLRFCAG